jgi:hypothetical protein
VKKCNYLLLFDWNFIALNKYSDLHYLYSEKMKQNTNQLIDKSTVINLITIYMYVKIKYYIKKRGNNFTVWILYVIVLMTVKRMTAKLIENS